MSETETQEKAESFPLMSLKLILTVFVLASIIVYLGGIVGEDSAAKKVKVMTSMISEVRKVAEANPERFADYRMDSLQCTLERYSFELYEQSVLPPPVRCQIKDKSGNQVDFSTAFIKEIVDIRMSSAH